MSGQGKGAAYFIYTSPEGLRFFSAKRAVEHLTAGHSKTPVEEPVVEPTAVKRRRMDSKPKAGAQLRMF